MAANFLLYYEGLESSGNLYDRVWIDKWCNAYKMRQIIIDPTERYTQSAHEPYYFRTIEDAMDLSDLAGYSFYFLEHTAESYWNEISLPTEHACYCIGHDQQGFYGYDTSVGTKIKVQHPNTEMRDGEWYATMVAPMLMTQIYH